MLTLLVISVKFPQLSKFNHFPDFYTFMINQIFVTNYCNNNNYILYLNRVGFKAQSLWGRVQINFNQMQVFEERGKPEYLGKNLSEQRREPTNSTHIWRRV